MPNNKVKTRDSLRCNARAQSRKYYKRMKQQEGAINAETLGK